MVHPVTHSVHVNDPPGEALSSTISTTSEVVEGVPNEKVDSYTLQVIERIFPRPANGMQFLALLLRLASIKQMAFGEAGEYKEVAAITVQSIRVLARKIGWGYDTTQKYVLLFCALGLLVKRRHRDQIDLYFPLERYQTTSAQLLDRILAGEIKARPKVLSFAKQVRRRYLVMLRESTNTTAFSAGHLPPSGQPAVLAAGSLPAAMENIRLLLESTQVDADTKHHLLQGIEQILAQPDLVEGRLSGQMGDSEQPVRSREGRLHAQMGDSHVPIQPPSGRLFDAKVDFPAVASPVSGRLSGKESTPVTQPDAENGRLSGQSGDSHPKMVDSQPIEPSNVNVIISNVININVNVKNTIEFLRQAFNEPPTKRGYYYNLHKQYTQAEAWLAAALETLIGMHRTKTVQDPGRWFYDRCVALHQTGIPPETKQLMERYGSLTYTQLVEQLRAPTTTIPAQQHPTSKPAPVRATIACRLPRQCQHPGMSAHELRELLRIIQHDERTCCFLTQPYRQADGTCALLVDDGMRHQTFVYSLREWRMRLDRLDRTKKIPAVFADVSDTR